MTYLTAAQMEQLLRPINARRVNRDGKGFSHVEAYDIRAHLIRIFGFARWSGQTARMELIYEDSHADGAKTKWNVGYRACCELTVHAHDGTLLATYTEWAVGDVTNYPSRGDAHDMAIKTAESQALKRCAVNLGDQFGLSLYNKGSVYALVKQTLVDQPESKGEEQPETVDQHIEELAPENEPVEDERERSVKPERAARNKPAARPRKAETEDVDLPADPPVEDSVDPEPEPAEEPDEVDQAVDAVKEAMPGSEVIEEVEHLSEKDLVIDEIKRLVQQARESTGDDALQTLKHALELAVKRGVRQHRLSNGETVGASLTAMMAKVAKG